MLLGRSLPTLEQRRALGIGSLLNPRDRLLIDGFDVFGPLEEHFVMRVLLFEVMDIA